MLQVYGRGYVIEYVISALMEDLEERRYRAYVTDALMLIAENTARSVNDGKYFTQRWIEKLLPVDNRTGDEIVLDTIRNAGLTVKGGELNGFAGFRGTINTG